MFLFLSKCLKKIKFRRRRETNVLDNHHQRVIINLPRQSSLPNYDDVSLNVNNIRLSFDSNMRQVNEKEEAPPPPYPGI